MTEQEFDKLINILLAILLQKTMYVSPLVIERRCLLWAVRKAVKAAEAVARSN